MSKKKKKKKSRSQRKAANVNVVKKPNPTNNSRLDSSNSKQKAKKPQKINLETTAIVVEDNVYVKADIRKGLLLTGFVIAIYVVLWFLLQYTDLSSKIINLF